MGSRAGLSCLWPPTRQSFAPSPPQFQLFSHSDEFSEACLLFVIVRECEQEGLGKTVQTGGKGRVRTVLVHLPSSSLFFPCLAGLKINMLWPHSLAGAQCFWGLSATRLIADSFCFLIYRSPKGSRAMHFFYSFFFFLPSWICSWVVQYQPQYWETAKSSSGSMTGILGRYHLKPDLGISPIAMPCQGWNLQWKQTYQYLAVWHGVCGA